MTGQMHCFEVLGESLHYKFQRFQAHFSDDGHNCFFSYVILTLLLMALFLRLIIKSFFAGKHCVCHGFDILQNFSYFQQVLSSAVFKVLLQFQFKNRGMDAIIHFKQLKRQIGRRIEIDFSGY